MRDFRARIYPAMALVQVVRSGRKKQRVMSKSRRPAVVRR